MTRHSSYSGVKVLENGIMRPFDPAELRDVNTVVQYRGCHLACNDLKHIIYRAMMRIGIVHEQICRPPFTGSSRFPSVPSSRQSAFRTPRLEGWTVM